jgi:phospholipase/lecithinase/hemolysin
MTIQTWNSSRYLLFLAALFSASSSANEYSTIVGFGDSLTDTGNKYVDTGLLNRPPYDLLNEFRVPDGPYAGGGLQHSNGATWIEQYARPLDLGDAVRPSLQNPGEATNYAYGGARARGGSPEAEQVELGCLENNNNKHLTEQVTTFLGDMNLNAPSDALYVLFIGGNDVADAVRALQCDPTGRTSVGVIIGGALTSVGNNIFALYRQGARKFVVLNSPDLGLTPAFTPPLNSDLASFFGSCFSLLYNFGTFEGSPVPPECGFPAEIPGLAHVLAGLQSSLPGIEITGVDIYSKFVQLVTAPSGNEPQNGTEACVTPEVSPYACRDADNHVFWDGIHPTKVVHGLIADEVVSAIGE